MFAMFLKMKALFKEQAVSCLTKPFGISRNAGRRFCVTVARAGLLNIVEEQYSA